MLDLDIWQPVDNNSTGFLGERRNTEWAKRDMQYGEGNWRMGWLVDGKYLEYPEVCQFYGNAYYEYFTLRPELLDYLIDLAADVYDDRPVTAEAGYDDRGQSRTHIHDSAIRESVKRHGRQFRGAEPFQIGHFGNEHPLAIALSPGQVPFYRRDWLSRPDNLDEIRLNAWWLPGSVEDFYQRAKRLCVKSVKTKLTL